MSGILKGIKAAFGDVEMAPYTVVAERDNYEERLYPARKWACTQAKGIEQTALVSPMFRTLFNYISGKNVPNIRIDMTSPVTTYVEPGPGPTCESTFTMAFLIPEEHQEDPPAPPDNTIFIEDRPEMRVLTRRYGGYTSDEIIIKEAKGLAEAIKKNGEEGVNFEQYYTAGYDPPFKLFGRRNEIWFVKKAEKEEVMNGDVAKEKVEKKAEVAQENGDVQKEELGKQVANAEGEAKQENGEVVHVTD